MALDNAARQPPPRVVWKQRRGPRTPPYARENSPSRGERHGARLDDARIQSVIVKRAQIPHRGLSQLDMARLAWCAVPNVPSFRVRVRGPRC